MDNKAKDAAATAEVETKANVQKSQTEQQKTELAQPDVTTIEDLTGQIFQLAEKIFEVNAEASLGGEHGGAVDVACAMLDQLKSVIEANERGNLRVVELQNALVKSKAENDNAAQKIAKLEAGAAVAVAAAADVIEEVEIKRPKPGAQLKLAKKLPTSLHVSDALSNGVLFQVVLADSDGRALDVRPLLGSGSMLIARGNDGPAMELLLADAINIDPANTSVAIREAWLLDTSGHGLSSCRLSSDLVGGGGLAAQIPARSFVFRFDDPEAPAA